MKDFVFKRIKWLRILWRKLPESSQDTFAFVLLGHFSWGFGHSFRIWILIQPQHLDKGHDILLECLLKAPHYWFLISFVWIDWAICYWLPICLVLQNTVLITISTVLCGSTYRPICHVPSQYNNVSTFLFILKYQYVTPIT